MCGQTPCHTVLNQFPYNAFPKFKRTWSFAVTPLDQLRLRLTDHDFDRLMQAAKPVPVPDRDAFVREVAAEVGRSARMLRSTSAAIGIRRNHGAGACKK